MVMVLSSRSPRTKGAVSALRSHPRTPRCDSIAVHDLAPDASPLTHTPVASHAQTDTEETGTAAEEEEDDDDDEEHRQAGDGQQHGSSHGHLGRRSGHHPRRMCAAELLQRGAVSCEGATPATVSCAWLLGAWQSGVK